MPWPVTAKDPSNLDERLMEAVHRGDLNVVRRLVEEGADVNSRFRDSETPLWLAAYFGHIEVAKFLLENGADVNAKNDSGNTALDVASRKGHAHVIKLLKEHGANASSSNRKFIIGTVKLILIAIILAVVGFIHRDRPLKQPFFESHMWTLKDVYHIIIPLLALVSLHFILHNTLTKYAGYLSSIFILIFCVVVCGWYYIYFKKLYNINSITFGLEKAKFLTTGVRNANIVLIYALLFMIFIWPKLPQTSLGSPNNTLNLSVYSRLIILLLLGVTLESVLEELLFRGILYTPVARKIGPLMAVVLLSGVWALWHLHHSSFETLRNAVLFLILYVLYIKSTSLYGPIIWHVTLNFVATRPLVGKILAGHIDVHTLDKFYIYSLLTVLVIINSLWLSAYMQRARPLLLQRITSKTRDV